MRLIDIDPILAWANDPEVHEPYGVRGSELVRKLWDAPIIETIDAVSVVRCDECKYCKEKGTSDCPNGYGYLYCTQKKSIVYEDDYCSWGEKR